MPGPGEQQGSNDTDALIWVGVLMGAFMLSGWLVDHYREEMNVLYGALAAIHVAPFAWLTMALPFLDYLLLPFGDALAAYEFLGQGGYAGMSPDQAAEVNRIARNCALFIYAPPLLWVLIRSTLVRPEDVYWNRHNMDTMIAEHAKTWWTGRLPNRIDFLKEQEFDLRRTADEVGRRQHALQASAADMGALLRPSAPAVAPPPWARAVRPEEWLVATGATYDEEAYSRITGSADRSRPVKFTNESAGPFEFEERWRDVSIEGVRELLEAEIGPVWTGRPWDLPPHLRALMAVCAKFLDYDTSSGNRLLQDLGALYEIVCRQPVGAFDKLLQAEPGYMESVDAILASQAGTNLLDRMSGHYYLYTACCRMLEVARKDRGVLAGGSIQWLKRENRRLWYVLGALGSEVASMEGAAVIAHYRAEVQYESPMARPAVYQAARAVVEDYLDMRPERVEAREKKAARSRTPGQTIHAIFDNPQLLEQEAAEEAAERERAEAERKAAEEAAREAAQAGGGPEEWGARARPRMPPGRPQSRASDMKARWQADKAANLRGEERKRQE